MEGQDSFIMREFEDAEVEFGEDGGDVIVDVGNNADLYAANQESTGIYAAQGMRLLSIYIGYSWCTVYHRYHILCLLIYAFIYFFTYFTTNYTLST